MRVYFSHYSLKPWPLKWCLALILDLLTPSFVYWAELSSCGQVEEWDSVKTLSDSQATVCHHVVVMGDFKWSVVSSGLRWTWMDSVCWSFRCFIYIYEPHSTIVARPVCLTRCALWRLLARPRPRSNTQNKNVYNIGSLVGVVQLVDGNGHAGRQTANHRLCWIWYCSIVVMDVMSTCRILNAIMFYLF